MINSDKKIEPEVTLRMMVSKKTEMSMKKKLSMNQAIQWTPLPRPITFIVSFSRCSFSYTMDLMIMEQAYTHDKVMNSGNVREMAMMN